MLTVYIVFYVIGSLIAIGMVLVQCFNEIRESKSDYFDMCGHLIMAAVLRVLFLTFIFLLLATLFSWISVGFIYMQGSHNNCKK